MLVLYAARAHSNIYNNNNNNNNILYRRGRSETCQCGARSSLAS